MQVYVLRTSTQEDVEDNSAHYLVALMHEPPQLFVTETEALADGVARAQAYLDNAADPEEDPPGFPGLEQLELSRQHPAYNAGTKYWVFPGFPKDYPLEAYPFLISISRVML